MIKTENKNGLIRTFSDSGFYILQTDTGVEYTEAWDVSDSGHVYTETDKLIDESEISEELKEVIKILKGESVNV